MDIPSNICCKKCGSVNAYGARGRWGPHTEKVTCRDCRAVTWGFGPSKRLRALRQLTDALKLAEAQLLRCSCRGHLDSYDTDMAAIQAAIKVGEAEA